MRRVENLALWQSYAAKKTSLFQRATHEGVSDSRLKDYEMKVEKKEEVDGDKLSFVYVIHGTLSIFVFFWLLLVHQDDRLMFHGSAPDVIPKICQQGFNRSFCGKNAVVYGKVGILDLILDGVVWLVCSRISFILFCHIHSHSSHCPFFSHTAASPPSVNTSAMPQLLITRGCTSPTTLFTPTATRSAIPSQQE